MSLWDAAGPAPGPAVVALTPSEFLDWANGKLHEVTREGQLVALPPPWQPGQHFALIGKTREGKTNFAIWLIDGCRRYVLALDPKGHDETLGKSGWQRVATVPGGAARHRIGSKEWRVWRQLDTDRAEGRPVKIIAGIQTRTKAADLANRQLMRDAIEYCREVGGFTLFVDEHQVLSDPRMFNLGNDIARQAISAARDRTSLVGAMQYLAWVERAGVRQATLIALWKTKSRDLIQTAAREAGRPWREVMAAVDELPKYWVLIIPDDLRAPYLMVQPPKVT